MTEIKESLVQNQESQNSVNSVESRHVTDQSPEPFVPREVETFLKKIEKDPLTNSNPTGLTDLTNGPQPKVMSTTRNSFVSGFKKKVDDVGNWLSRFIFRQIKLKEGNVVFKPSDDS